MIKMTDTRRSTFFEDLTAVVRTTCSDPDVSALRRQTRGAGLAVHEGLTVTVGF